MRAAEAARGQRGHGPAFEYRPALDGVRALAVAAVLLFHGGVTALPGGFLGVDAFFVLSGFLITSLLLAERARTGRIRLAAFWGRRARRLLPALLVLLVVVVVAGRYLLPDVEVGLLRGDALAALGYVANWRMIYRGSDYFTQTAAPSPLQHTWSLGIEEQFYWLWPLIVIGLLALKGRRAVFVASVLGAAGSALAAAALYRPEDVNRAYFGTDSRAQALLIGCALAALPLPNARKLLGALAALGTLGTAWLWAHASGTDEWLYRGGLTGAALAVAAVLAHAVASPAGPTARILALPPLVWLGRISYGVYLWHWPLFQFVTAERTRLSGVTLLAVRCALTVGVAAASFYLMEQPIRRGNWLRRVPRLAPVGATITALAGVAAIVAVATLPAPAPSSAPVPVVALPAPAPASASAPATPGRPPPMRRSGRAPGEQPRVTFFGDSVAWTLGTYLPPHPGLQTTVRALQGCGIAVLPDILMLGSPHTNYPYCPAWPSIWRTGVDTDDPDVAVILLDRWELMDRKLDGVYRHVGQPEYDTYLTGQLDQAVTITTARGARVVLLTAPYTHRAERPDGGIYPEDDPARVNAWNALLRSVAAGHPDVVTVLDLNKVVCPNGVFTWTINGMRVRSDGLHFTSDAVQKLIAPWLLPQLATLATT
ncbi:MAG: acyltransferase [Actinobacteria bacterium 13_2_20CM_2_71_6]|nr:MAG: acyltransferase [Actinobacteria bacterium 13_2_20CM_2_71_6]